VLDGRHQIDRRERIVDADVTELAVEESDADGR